MKTLKILILFVFVLYGCSSKHVLRKEVDLLERNVLALWEELECKIVECDSQGVYIGIQVKDFDVVREHLSVKEIYKYGSGDLGTKAIPALGGFVIGCAGCFFGYKIGVEMDEDYVQSLLFPNPSEQGCAFACLFALPGFILMGDNMRQGNEYTKIMPDFFKIDTVCVDSMVLIKQKVKILSEKTDSEKEYYTDEKGNIGLNFDEIIPEPTVADSILNLIIQYEDLVDTVEVKIR